MGDGHQWFGDVYQVSGFRLGGPLTSGWGGWWKTLLGVGSKGGKGCASSNNVGSLCGKLSDLFPKKLEKLSTTMHFVAGSIFGIGFSDLLFEKQTTSLQNKSFCTDSSVNIFETRPLWSPNEGRHRQTPVRCHALRAEAELWQCRLETLRSPASGGEMCLRRWLGVGGLEHFSFSHILGIINPID